MYTQIKKAAHILSLSVLMSTLLALPSIAAPQTSSGTIQVDGSVVGPAPATAPTIEAPASNTTFTTKAIVIKGSCVADLIVRIYRNGFFAGSTLCQTDGTYSLTIDLFVDKNTLVARQFDSANQSSPDSNEVFVFYTPVSPPVLPNQPTVPVPERTEIPGETPTGTAQFQLVIEYDYTLQSVFVNNPFRLPVRFAGGAAPYAVNVNWGDGTNDVSSRENTDIFSIDHTYTTPGYYTATISISDKNGDKASLQFVVLVNGKTADSALDTLLSSKNEWWWQATQIGVFTNSVAGSFLLGRQTRRRDT